MALALPQNFNNDIQSRDTNLIPLVIIGTPFFGAVAADYTTISTNQWTNGIWTAKPLLLNIPSLKESIDIEKRNYKISSVNLDISNFPYEGERFSELVSDTSLINTEVRIFWVSPSVTGIAFEEYVEEQSELGIDLPDIAFQIYNGTIRRYTHDDEKVRLVVEDRSQATLHKDLPTEYLTGSDVPDKYKNKPYPMVYGFVDRSPCVIKSSPIIDEWGIGSGNIDIYPDYVAPESIIDQYIYFGDKYLPIPASMENISTEAGTDAYYTNFHYHAESSKIIDTSITNFIRLLSLGGNPISQNMLLTREYKTIEDYTIVPLREKTHDLDDFISPEDNINYTSVYNEADKEILGTFVRDSSGGVGAWDGTSKLKNIAGTENDIYTNLVTTTYIDRAFPACLIKTDIAVGDFKADIGFIDLNIDTYYGSVSEQDGTHSLKLSLRTGSATRFYSHNVEFSNTGDSWYSLSSDSKVSAFVGSYFKFSEDDDDPNINLASLDSLKVALFSTTSGGGVAGIICASKFVINSLNITRYGLIEDVVAQDFYANVDGRVTKEIYSEYDILLYEETPTAPDVIAHIVENELDPTINITEPGFYPDWRYAFTVDKKINSKKLIENIASASPYIPRFDNMGNFKFDVIRQEYNSGSILEDNQTIKEIDVIDFSFSRTPIEDVVTKIEFKYKWDYARGEFEKRRALDIQDFACADWVGNYESFDYYGLPQPESNNDANDTWTHLESTLVIDDDRGKYIRDDETAERFVCWMMSWYCNQHLIMKVKLPLKYMNLEIGDIVEFDYLLGEISPYGINYKSGTSDSSPTFQKFFPYFMVTETNKRLDYVEISCTQMHELVAQVADLRDDDGNMEYN